ncbi:MAG: UDP-N-acetylglucosamine 2-epimerase (hydrolyzing) [Deltaproteobacteria bacterium]|nr:MAG: UDP-N-acetylglucosamine 2-epimerase (hydrolyzing) [Deltaproteobacteria bacterium]
MRKIACVITSRASYARIKTALQAINKHSDLELQLIAAASVLLEKYGNAVNVIERDGLNVLERVYMIVEGENPVTMAKSVGLGIIEITTALDNLKPDLVITIADRFETIATAIASSYLNIPLVHVQGGEITGSIDERVRHSITKLSDYHFVSNKTALERVVRMGEYIERVFITGCPSIDLAHKIMEEPDGFDPFQKYGGVGTILDIHKPYIILLQHPVTTEYAMAKEQMWRTLMAVYNTGIQCMVFWPNLDAGSDGTSKAIRTFREKFRDNTMHFFKNMPPEDFLRVVLSSACIVGNSSVAIRECSFMGVPAVTIGSRQHGRERGRNVIDVDCDTGQIADAINRQVSNGRYPGENIYGEGNAGKKIADLLATIPLTQKTRLAY